MHFDISFQYLSPAPLLAGSQLSSYSLAFNHQDEQEDLQPEVAREEIVEYDGGVKAVDVQECESSEGVEVILIDQEMRNQGILIIEEPVVYC